MPAPSDRARAYMSTVTYNLGPAGAHMTWSLRTLIPTAANAAALQEFARRLGPDFQHWFIDDDTLLPLEACQGRWRPAVDALAFAVRPGGGVPSIGESAGRFDTHIGPLGLARGTRSKYARVRRMVMTWAVWKGVFAQLLPMSDEFVRAFVWDSLAFAATFPVLKQALDAIKAWHRKLGMRIPLDGAGDYRRFSNQLKRFQPSHHPVKFPIHAEAVRRLLTLPLPPHPPCAGVKPPTPRGRWVRCPTCWAYLIRWFCCLAGATGTLTACRCLELGLLKTCCIWWQYDFLVGGWARFKEGAAYNIQVRKNDQHRVGHQARVGVPKDKRYDLLAQTREAIRLLGTEPGPNCEARFDSKTPCRFCPPLFPRRVKKGTEFDLKRHATSPEISAMIIAGLAAVGFNTTGFSGISARRGGLSTAIEGGVPEAILWMQSGHSQDLAARRYVALHSPALLYATYESFHL